LFLDLNFSLHLSDFIPSIPKLNNPGAELNALLQEKQIVCKSDNINELMLLYYAGTNPNFNAVLDALPHSLPYERVPHESLIPELITVYQTQYQQTPLMAAATAELANAMLDTMSDRAGTTPEQIRTLLDFIPTTSTDNAFYEPDVESLNRNLVDGFYSRLAFNIEKTTTDYTAKKWIEVLGSGDEMIYTGLQSYLQQKTPTDIVSCKELLEYLEKNPLSISITSYYNNLPTCAMEEAIAAAERGEVIFVVPDVKSSDTLASDIESSLYPIHKDDITNPHAVYCLGSVLEDYLKNQENLPKYESYTTIGDYRNYKEIVITYDPRDTMPIAYSKSSHYPDKSNILLHLRTSERITADRKKVFYIEELQSDWAQSGRENGFNDNTTHDSVNDIFLRFEAKKNEISSQLYQKPFLGLQKNAEIQDVLKLAREALTQPETELLKKYESEYLTAHPFAGPFVENTSKWVKLGLKVVLQHAIKTNADYIAWADGRAQNFVYSFAKNADRVIISHDLKNNTYEIAPYLLTSTGEKVFFDSKLTSEKKLASITGSKIFSTLLDSELANEFLVTSSDFHMIYDFNLDNPLLYNTGLISFYGNVDTENHGLVGDIAASLFQQESCCIDLATTSTPKPVRDYDHALELLTPDDNGDITPLDYYTKDTTTGERYWTSHEDVEEFISEFETEEDYLKALSDGMVFYYNEPEKEQKIYLNSYHAILTQLQAGYPVVFPQQTISTYTQFMTSYPSEHDFMRYVDSQPGFSVYYVADHTPSKLACYGMEITDAMRDMVYCGMPLFQIVGESGVSKLETAREILDNLALAKKMMAHDASDLVIRLATGWELIGQKWRYEIDDSPCKLLGKLDENKKLLYPQGTKLYDALDYPMLYKMYPELRNTTCFISITPSNAGLEYGRYDDVNKTFSVTATTKSKAVSTLLHELQHYIQYREGFDQGGTSRDGKLTYEQYLALPGEFESRNVVNRHEFPFLKLLPIKETNNLCQSPAITNPIESATSAYIQSLINSGEQAATPRVASAATRFVSDMHAVITAGTSPSITAPLHELAHVYERYLTTKEIAAVEAWSGSKHGTRMFSERFAEGCERYIYDSAGPKMLQPIFEQFKKWIEKAVDLMTHIKNIPPLNDDMRKIYTTMFSQTTPKKHLDIEK